MPDRALKVAIAGCGEVAQVIHLPTLALMNHQYKVVAISDVSNDLLRHCQAKWSVEKAYKDYYEMLGQEAEIDVVFILTADEYHTPYAVAAADAGKAVFIEKPMALTRQDADEIIAAQERNQVPVFVGYMRRYAEAFNVFKELARGLKSIEYVRVRDIIGENDFFVQQSGAFPIRPTDIPSSASDDRARLGREIVERAIPSRASNPRDVATYRLLGSLGSHDLSAMREVFGVPKSCFAATRNARFDQEPFLTALLEFERFTAVYETGIDRVRKFDCSIEVAGDGKRYRIDYDTPYVKGLAITVSALESSDDEGHCVERTIRPTYTDAYTLEMQELYKVVVEGKECKTGPRDAKLDLDVFDMIMGALRN
ncbi:hypothetical protein JCM10212_006362 [Sporobolomyces blumeae]